MKYKIILAKSMLNVLYDNNNNSNIIKSCVNCKKKNLFFSKIREI